MIDLLVKGGPVMIPIGIFSVIALAIFVERIFVLQRSRVIPQKLLARTKELLSKGMLSEAKILCEQDSSPLAFILCSAFSEQRAEHREVRMEEAGRQAVFALKRRLDLLGTTAAVSPLLGLLGTVTGMIKVFQDVTVYGVGNPADLAQGIWEALITTAAGLTVAIPAYLAYRYLLAKVESLAIELESVSSELLELINQHSEGLTKEGK